MAEKILKGFNATLKVTLKKDGKLLDISDITAASAVFPLADTSVDKFKVLNLGATGTFNTVQLFDDAKCGVATVKLDPACTTLLLATDAGDFTLAVILDGETIGQEAEGLLQIEETPLSLC